jgi:two-component system, NtrC family, response regulator AlgB
MSFELSPSRETVRREVAPTNTSAAASGAWARSSWRRKFTWGPPVPWQRLVVSLNTSSYTGGAAPLATAMPRAQPSHPSSRAPAASGSAPILRALVIDDDASIRRTLALCLESLGCTVAQVASGREALRTVREHPVDLAFCDLKLERESGLDLIPRLVAELPQLDVVVITAYAAIDTAVEAMRRGARDYLAKPFTPAQIRMHVERARERLAAELRVADLEAGYEEAAAQLETASPRMQAALDILSRAAAHDVPVLLTGERGTGKRLLARRLHAQSPRRDGPFAAVSCGAGEDQVAATLFGRARLRPAGARDDEPGQLEGADGGTLFLDAVADLAPGLQDAVLRLLKEKRFERPGETQPHRVDVRIVAATSRDLEAEVNAGRFREDLRYALNVVEVVIPPLRERTEDILPLSRALIAQLASRSRREPPTVARAAEARLVAYSWPGNLPELRNAIVRALILSPGKVLGPECFPDPIPTAADQPVLGGKFSAEEIEKEHARRVMGWAGSLEEASRILGVAVTTLWRKRKKWTR